MARLLEIVLACWVLVSTSNGWVYFGDHANVVGFLEIIPTWSGFRRSCRRGPAFWRSCWSGWAFEDRAGLAELLEIMPAWLGFWRLCGHGWAFWRLCQCGRAFGDRAGIPELFGDCAKVDPILYPEGSDIKHQPPIFIVTILISFNHSTISKLYST